MNYLSGSGKFRRFLLLFEESLPHLEAASFPKQQFRQCPEETAFFLL